MINYDNAKITNTNRVSNGTANADNSSIPASKNYINLKVDNEFLNRLKLFGIENPEDVENILKICSDLNIDTNIIKDDKLKEIITKYNADKTASKVIENSEIVDKKVELKEQESKPDFKSEYNKKDLNGKIEDCYIALAKNIYTTGFKDKNGNEAIKPNDLGKSWEELSKQEQQKYVQRIKTFIDKDESLKAIKEQFNSSDKISVEQKTNAIDALMRGILASTHMEMSYTDYLKKDEFERAEIIEEYLGQNEDTLNDNDKYYFENYKIIKQKISEIIKKNNPQLDITNLDAREINIYAKCCNIDKDELLYQHLKEKADKGVLTDPKDKDLYEFYSRIYGNTEYQERLKESKAQNIHNLELRYNELKSKENLSPVEKRSLELIEKTLNASDVKDLKKLYSEMPQPSTEDEAILNEIRATLDGVREHVQGSKLEAGFLIQEIEKKFNGRPIEEKEKYINTYLKYDKSAIANLLYLHYKDKTNKVINNDTTDLGSLYIDQLNDEQAGIHHKKVLENYESDNQYYNKIAVRSINIEHDVLLKAEGNHDNKKSGYTDLVLDTKNNKLFNKATDVTYTILDDSMRDASLDRILNNENADAQNGIYALGKIHEAGKSQNKVLELTTGRWKGAASWAAENNVIANMDNEYQVGGFKTLHSNIDKWFEGDEAVKHLNSLSDQIKDCDKNNQLEMHNDIMSSKYSEVQTHAAGNIKNYDPSVQADAYETVFASGNQKAVETAFQSLQTAPSEIQNAVLKPIINAAFDENSAESVKVLLEKIKSGSGLTQEEYNSLTAKQKQEYKAAYFKSLSPAKQIALINSLSDMSTKKAVIKKIAQSDTSFLKQLIDSDAKTAEMVYGMGILQDYIKSRAEFKSGSNNDFQNLLTIIEKKEAENHTSKFNENPITARTLRNIPEGLDSIYRRHAKGGLLA